LYLPAWNTGLRMQPPGAFTLAYSETGDSDARGDCREPPRSQRQTAGR